MIQHTANATSHDLLSLMKQIKDEQKLMLVPADLVCSAQHAAYVMRQNTLLCSVYLVTDKLLYLMTVT